MIGKYWAYMVPMGDCVVWTRATSSGYPQGTVNGKKQRLHRAVYEAYYGRLKPGECALHRCDRKRCLKPSHLFRGTHAVNNRDKADKGRAMNRNAGKRECDNGHPLTGDNLYTYPSGKQRACRTCKLEIQRVYRARKRALAGVAS